MVTKEEAKNKIKILVEKYQQLKSNGKIRNNDEEPKVCPKYKSPYWNTPRKSEERK